MNLYKVNRVAFLYKEHFSTDTFAYAGIMSCGGIVITLQKEKNEIFCLSSIGVGWVKQNSLEAFE